MERSGRVCVRVFGGGGGVKGRAIVWLWKILHMGIKKKTMKIIIRLRIIKRNNYKHKNEIILEVYEINKVPDICFHLTCRPRGGWWRHNVSSPTLLITITVTLSRRNIPPPRGRVVTWLYGYDNDQLTSRDHRLPPGCPWLRLSAGREARVRFEFG